MTQIEYLTTDEVAAELRIDPETVRRWIRREGGLPAIPAGRGYRIARTDLSAYLAKRAAR